MSFSGRITRTGWRDRSKGESSRCSGGTGKDLPSLPIASSYPADSKKRSYVKSNLIFLFCKIDGAFASFGVTV